MFRKRSTNRFEKLFSFETSKIDDKVSFAQFFFTEVNSKSVPACLDNAVFVSACKNSVVFSGVPMKDFFMVGGVTKNI